MRQPAAKTDVRGRSAGRWEAAVSRGLPGSAARRQRGKKAWSLSSGRELLTPRSGSGRCPTAGANTSAADREVRDALFGPCTAGYGLPTFLGSERAARWGDVSSGACAMRTAERPSLVADANYASLRRREEGPRFERSRSNSSCCLRGLCTLLLGRHRRAAGIRWPAGTGASTALFMDMRQ